MCFGFRSRFRSGFVDVSVGRRVVGLVKGGGGVAFYFFI